MNEETKHIESCRAEDPLAQTMEACGNESNLQAALQPLLVETMPGYVPVATTAPTSTIAELPGVLISIIRRVATKPLTILGERPAKQSLLGSLVTTWNAIRQRLSGNPSLGIPDRRADMTAHSLPTALALLSDRKITNGFSTTDGIHDGMSLARLLCDTSAANSVTEIVDDNDWNLLNKGLSFILSMFPSLNKLTLNCKTCTVDVGSVPNNTLFAKLESVSLVNKSENPYSAWIYINGDLIMPELKSFYANQRGNICQETSIRGRFIAEKLESLVTGYNPDFYRTTTLTMFYAPSLKTLSGGSWGQSRMLGSDAENSADLLTKVVVGYGTCFSHANYLTNRPNLIHVELAQEGGTSFTLAGWSPTNAIDASRTDLIEQGSTAENNLQQFLLNFRNFIALRLANRTGQSKLTLTLSAGVFSAVFTNESGSTEEIVARNAIRDEIRGEITDRNWKVTDSTNNFNN